MPFMKETLELKQPANDAKTKDDKARTPNNHSDEREQQTVKSSFSKAP